uniref:Ig-like domain-containing protein n=1 Tax=Scleropages formosus TaxID=113540 RepID=A0A8C9SGX6_SCLFO
MKFKKLLGFFVLLLCVSVEADDCPMKIDPPAVVVKYGDPVSVNCTVFTEHVGMGWVAKQNPVPNQPGVQFLLWTVENLTVWDINPQCFANFKGVPQCLRKVSVTVYNTPDSVSIRSENHTGPLVEGYQYKLVCEVQNVAPVQNLTVKWYKGTEVVNITLHPGESKTPVNVSSTLLITPNRTDDGAQYKCVAELQLGSEREWSPPAVESEAFSITVHYPPVISEGDKNVIVDQGSMVSLNCTVQGNPSPLFQWTSPSGNVDFLTPKKNNSIISADSSGVYTCSASNYLGSTTRTVSITVVKKDYTIFAVIPVAILFLLIAFILFLMKRKRQYGNYSVSKRHSEHTVNPNSIPMQCLISNGAHQSLQKSTADTEDQD